MINLIIGIFVLFYREWRLYDTKTAIKNEYSRYYDIFFPTLYLILGIMNIGVGTFELFIKV